MSVKSQAKGPSQSQSQIQSQESGWWSAPGVGVHIGVPGVNGESESKSEPRSIQRIQKQKSGVVMVQDPLCFLNTSWYASGAYIRSGITKTTVSQITQGGTSHGIQPPWIVTGQVTAAAGCHCDDAWLVGGSKGLSSSSINPYITPWDVIRKTSTPFPAGIW